MTTLKQQMHAWMLERSRTSPSSWRDIDCEDAFFAGAQAGFAAAREIYTRSEHCEHFGIHQQDWDWKYISFNDWAKDGGESE